jgi:hypothetical protein
MWILKILAFLWPFIKEMVLGDKTLREALKDNKKKVLLALMILASIGLNFFTISRLVIISKDHVVLQKKYVAATETLSELSLKINENKTKVVLPKQVSLPNNTSNENPKSENNKIITIEPKNKTKVDKSNLDRYARMKDNFDKMKAREEKEGIK